MPDLIRVASEQFSNPRVRGPLVRSLNQIKLLNLIQEQGPISRAGLAKLSRLSKPTVSSQVESLIRQGWVVEHGPGESGAHGGKKPTLLDFNADAGRLLAVEINPQEVKTGVADLNGRILRRLSLPMPPDRAAGSVLPLVRKAVKRMIAGEPGKDYVAAVAAPGQVDANRGVVLEADQFAWRSVAVRDDLESAFDMPVLVDNNVNMAALGEKHHGAAVREESFVVVRLDNGVGCGVFINGRLYHGSQWAAGEIAHMHLDAAHVTDEVGPRGFLESMVGSDRFEMQVRALTGRDGSALESLEIGKQDSGALRLLYEQFARYITAALANLVCAYDPSMVVLQGPLFEPILDEVNRVLTRLLPWRPQLCLSGIHEDAVLLGTLVAARAAAYRRIGQMMDDRASAPGVLAEA